MSKGFTIIEMIVVITIIAVLAGIVVTSVAIYLSRARDNVVKANVSQLAKKALTYYTEHSNFTGFTYSEFSGYGINAKPSTGEFLVYHSLPSNANIYWGQDATGAKGEIGNPGSAIYTLASAPAAGSCTPACDGSFEKCYCTSGSCISCNSGETCLNNQCVVQTESCGGTCANCGGYGSDDYYTDYSSCGAYMAGWGWGSYDDCCSAHLDGCYWDGAGCSGVACSGGSMETCGENCPGGSNDCTWQ